MIADALQRLRDHWRQRFTALTSDGEVMRDDLVKARMLRDCITDLDAALAALQGAGQDQYAGLAQDRASASIKPKDGQGSAAHPASNSAAGEARVPHEPPAHIVQFAIEASTSSPCRSKRGVVIFRGADLVSQGYNYKPRGFDCDGSDACKATCRDEAIHAEQQALLLVGRKAEGCDLLHVKTVGGMLVPSGPPSCVQCSKLALVTGILGVWLFRGEDGWVRYPIAEFHRLSLAAQEARPAPPLDWQPIATAPKDGRGLLLWSEHWTDGGKPVTEPTIARWSSFSNCFVTHEGEVYKPTLWATLPLPDPPAAVPQALPSPPAAPNGEK